MKILNTSEYIGLVSTAKANDLEDAIIVYHLKSPPRQTPEDQVEMKCHKCGARSGDDWEQCKGVCPMPGSPHFSDHNGQVWPLGQDWQPIKTAPRDGTWIIIEGEMNGGDTSSARIARWNPTRALDNDGVYEWQALDVGTYGDTIATDDDLWNWYCEGRVRSWMPLP